MIWILCIEQDSPLTIPDASNNEVMTRSSFIDRVMAFNLERGYMHHGRKHCHIKMYQVSSPQNSE